MIARKIFITGAFGIVGTALANLPCDKVLFDKKIPNEFKGKPGVVQGKIQDRNLLEQSMEGCQVVVHLAASASLESSWEEVLQNNILGTQTVLEASRLAGVEQVVFASSNHVVGMVELENTPHIYESGHGIMLTKEAEPRPDSYYGVSKLFGENLGRYFAERGELRFYALRIGGVRSTAEDHPYGDAESGVRDGECQRNDSVYEHKVKRLKALWLSRRDLLQLVQCCLDYDDSPFDIFYGVSNNPTRWLDIEYAEKQMGYQPKDNSVLWNEAPKSDVMA